MAAQRKTWREKLADDKGLPRVITLAPQQQERWGGRTMVIASPRQVDAAIRKIPKGQTATINDLRAALAKQHGTDTACPITTGIFSWIAAYAAAEDEAEGRKRVSPWWRVLKSDGSLNPKYPGGPREQQRRLRAEGVEVPISRPRSSPNRSRTRRRSAVGLDSKARSPSRRTPRRNSRRPI